MIIAKILFFILFLFESVIEKSDIEKFIANFILTQGKYTKQNVIIEFKSIPDRITIKEENVKLNISDISSTILRGNVTLPLDIMANERIVKRAYISMKIRTFDSIYVSSRNIKQNEVLTPDNIRKKWLETTQLCQQEIKSDAECLGKRIIKYLPENQPLAINIIENLPIINKGRSVKIRAKVNSVSIYTQGIAMQDGKLGDAIFVENSSNRKRLRGIVKDENTVEIIR
jgi:flagellar basal body P-ring formation protein FlgA